MLGREGGEVESEPRAHRHPRRYLLVLGQFPFKFLLAVLKTGKASQTNCHKALGFTENKWR
jgi:hypothetical protein